SRRPPFAAGALLLNHWGELKFMRNKVRQAIVVFVVMSFLGASLRGQEKPAAKPRARDLGVPFDGSPGPLNAITDVSGVAVGHTTLISGEGKLQIGKGPVRTG